MGVSESFQHYVLDPILLQFTSLFDLNGRLGLLFLGVSYAVAYLLFRYRKRHGLTEAASFWRFLGVGRCTGIHRPAWTIATTSCGAY